MENDQNLVWREKSKKTLCETAVLKVEQLESISPEGKEGSFVVLDAPEWGIVVPVVSCSDGNHFVMVRQWRHGSRSVSIEFPGGVLNPGEDPETGVIRELLEETGYRAGTVTHLATLSPNPAIMSNRFHVFAAENLTDTKNRNLDEDEYVDTLLVPVKEVYEKMGLEPYIHALMSTALFLYSRHRNENRCPC